MGFTNSVTVNLGRLTGVVYWDQARQTYAALLRLFDHSPIDSHPIDSHPIASHPAGSRLAGWDPAGPGSGYPPSWARYGLRTAEFLTPDALMNHLVALQLEPDDRSLVAVSWLARHVAEIEGEPELVGLVADDGRRRLWLSTPSGRLVELNPRLDHDDHRFAWGDAGPAAIETARVICEQAFLRRPHADVECFALTLAYEHLSEIDGDFSIGLNALCDWFLTDAELTTSLGPDDLDRIRHQLGLSASPARSELPA